MTAQVRTSPGVSPFKSKTKSALSLSHSSVKLRHPSRLHTRDLTANTFRIYVKYYMDNSRLWVEEGHPTSDLSGGRFSNVLTPKTLSRLRRVPELQELARKVIDAEDKRRRTEERRAKEQAAAGGASRQAKDRAKMSVRERMKRLFRQAILKLSDDGSIVICDGPKRNWRPDWSKDSSHLWKITPAVDMSALSSWTASASCGEDNEDDGLSDPPPEEESYVSLSPAYLGRYVEKAIKEIMMTPSACELGKRCGPTKDEILVRLRGDGRWRRVGEWAIEEALRMLKEEERVWDVGDGRWELTI